MGSTAVLITAILWGTTGFAAHYAPAGSNPFAIGAGAMGFGGLLMAMLALSSPGRSEPWSKHKTPLAWGVASLAVYPMAFYGAMHYAGIAIGTAINIGSSPLMAMLIERLTGRAALTARKAQAAGVSLLGLVLLCAGGAGHGAGRAPQLPLGVALGLAAGLTYAGYTTAAHEMIREGCPSNVAMGRMFGLSALFLVPFCLAAGGPLLEDERGLLVLGYLAVVPMALAYVIFGFGLRSVTPSTALTLTLVEPVVASVLAVAVVGEPMAVIGWAGMMLVLLGVLLLGRGDTASSSTDPGEWGVEGTHSEEIGSVP